jgi:hypothetical protein
MMLRRSALKTPRKIQVADFAMTKKLTELVAILRLDTLDESA